MMMMMMPLGRQHLHEGRRKWKASRSGSRELLPVGMFWYLLGSSLLVPSRWLLRPAPPAR